MAARVVWSRPANADLADIARWTVRHFGSAQARRYGAAIAATLHGLDRALHIAGARLRPELGDNIWTIPVGLGRSRHVLASSFDLASSPINVTVLRVLHDSMDLARHLKAERPT